MSEHPSQDAPGRSLRPVIDWLLVVLVIALHVRLTLYFDPPSVLFSTTPLSGCDYDTHISQAFRVLEGLTKWGRSWVYDVHLLAGHPNGVIFDADNKGWELVTFLLVQLGVPRGLAFNGFIVLAHALLLPVVYGSARLFDLRHRPALLAAALASCLWFFDAFVHFLRWVGTLAYGFSAYFWLLPLSLFYRFCERRHAGYALPCALSLGFALVLHPYSFFALVVPMGALYLRSARELTRGQHACVAGIVATALGSNAPWIVPTLQQWHYILDSAYGGQAGVSQLAADFFGVLVDTATTGATENRTSLRFLCFAAALFTLRSYVKRRDRRALPWVAALCFMLPLAYLGGYSHLTAQIQPYRFMGPSMFLATLAAADVGGELDLAARLRALPGATRAIVLALAALVSQHVGRDVVAFFPAELPEPPKLPSPVPVALDARYPPWDDYRHKQDHRGLWQLPAWVQERAAGPGRFLVQSGPLGEQLAWKTDAEIIGGFLVRNLAHSHANLFRRKLDATPTPAQVRTYLQAYAIEWVVLSFYDPWFSKLPELFEPHAVVAGTTILRTKVPISRFQAGRGEVYASTNRIVVLHTDPRQEVILRYHFHEALRCRPDCRMERSKNPAGGVPFIRVPAPHPASFAIVNTYGT